MMKKPSSEVCAYGVRVLLSRHASIRRMKRFHAPSEHGYKFWPSSWLLMDFLQRQDLPEGFRLVEVGCGWGLAGIYAAKRHGAIVTGVDADSSVFPYLRLHAYLNKVKISTLHRSLDSLKKGDLQKFDILIGSDICFWDSLASSLKKLIYRARRAGVQMVLIADPGRSPFDSLTESFGKNREVEVLDWSVTRPRTIHGWILKVGSYPPS